MSIRLLTAILILASLSARAEVTADQVGPYFDNNILPPVSRVTTFAHYQTKNEGDAAPNITGTDSRYPEGIKYIQCDLTIAKDLNADGTGTYEVSLSVTPEAGKLGLETGWLVFKGLGFPGGGLFRAGNTCPHDDRLKVPRVMRSCSTSDTGFAQTDTFTTRRETYTRSISIVLTGDRLTIDKVSGKESRRDGSTTEFECKNFLVVTSQTTQYD